MRYLLNAVAADGNRFEDVKERFIFTSSNDHIDLEDWRGRGITPIPYSPENGHAVLLETLKRWSVLSATSEQHFISAAKPFLQEVWPQERSLTTQGISRAFAELPAVSQEAFVEAMQIIERFLVPFDCWSLIDYGLYGNVIGIGENKLSIIDSLQKAEAFLRLLDLTIGTAEWSVIPHDLSEALDQIRKVAPKLEQNETFRRLATAARRY